MPLRRQVLIATLGTQPQVVTLAVDLLAEDENVRIDEVYVIHTAAEGRIGEALTRLQGEFPHTQYRGRRCVLKMAPILKPDGTPVCDIRSEDDARNTFRTIFRTVKEQKRAGKTVHLSIAGGRNSMGAYGVVTAQILFEKEDRLWHVISAEKFERSRAMHRSNPYDAVLTSIPVLCWSGVSPPVLAALAREDDPFRAIEAQQQWLNRQADEKREAFLRNDLTPKEWEVLVDYVTRRGTNREIAARLGVKPSTIETHMRHIYDKMRPSFSYDESVPIGRETVMYEFAEFFDRRPDLRAMKPD
jgi:CRISPR-associated protein Csx14